MVELEKNTARESLHSSSRLPIIIVMKIWFWIGAEHDGPPPERYCSAHSKARAVDFLRRGAACCARFSVSDQRHPLADTRSLTAVTSPRKYQARRTSTKTFPTPEKRRELPHFSGISNRFWPKNRSYRKQTIKPCLTGAKTHIRHFGFLALFANRFHVSRGRRRIKTERFFRSWTTSTRFWSKSRSCRKQTIRPLLPGATTTRVHSHFSAHLPAVQILDDSAKRIVRVRRSSCWTCAILAGEIATNGLHRTYPE